LQQLGADSIFVSSGYSLCRWPPPHLLAVGPNMTKVLAVVALPKSSLSSVFIYLDNNMVKAIPLEYLLRFYISCHCNNE
jgi:hypothetical protein